MTLRNFYKGSTEDEQAFMSYVGYCHVDQSITLADLKQFEGILSKSFLEGLLQHLGVPDLLISVLHPSVFQQYNVVFKGLSFRELSHLTLPFYFEDCCFAYAGLTGADLTEARFYNCNFYKARLEKAKGFNPEVSLNSGVDNLPQGVDLIGYKKVFDVGRGEIHAKSCILKVKIPEWAKRSKSTGSKCRASAAISLALFDLTGAEITNLDGCKIESYYRSGMPEYLIGEVYYPDDWDDNRWNECSNGVHFFMNFEEAKNY